MKTLPAALSAFLQSATTYGRADLFAIALQNGQTFYTTSSQTDITYSGNVYRASYYGAWERGAITSEAAFEPTGTDMPLRAMIGPNVLLPGTQIPAMQTVALGLFDGAAVTVHTAYWAEGEAPNAARGVEIKFVGQIMDFKNLGRSVVEFTVASPVYLLNQKIPSKLIQATCRHTLFDANCTLSPASFSTSRIVGAGSTALTLIWATPAAAPPYYTQGYAAFTSGQNNGLQFYIKQQLSTTSAQLGAPVPLPLAIGDGFTLYAGCDKSQATCNSKFSNLINFGGMPYVPNPELAV